MHGYYRLRDSADRKHYARYNVEPVRNDVSPTTKCRDRAMRVACFLQEGSVLGPQRRCEGKRFRAELPHRADFADNATMLQVIKRIAHRKETE